MPNNNAEEAEVEWLYEELQDLFEVTAKKKKKLFSSYGTEMQSRKSRDS